VSEDAEAGAKDGIQGPGGSSFVERMRVRSSVGLLLALTDERGGFELANLSEGSYTVLARASGYEEAKRTGVRAGEEVKDIPLSRFSAVHGTVREASTGRPIPAFTVYAINKARRGAEKESSDWRVGSEGDLKFVDPAGRFLFDGLRPGEYEVIVYASSFLAHHEDVKLAAGEEVSLDVKFDQGARIEGVVTDAESGLPIEGVQVSGTRQIPQEEFDAMMKKGRVSPPMTPLSGSAEATSGADGAFVLDGLLPGEYAVWAWHPYFVLVYDNSNRTQLEALGTAMVALRMRLTGRVEGDVSGLRVAAGNGLLMGHRLVFEKLRGEKTPEAEKSQTERWGTGLDPAGHFHAENLRPGQFRISVKSQAYREGKFIELTPGGGIGQRESVGREETTALGEVEVRAGETTRFRGSVK